MVFRSVHYILRSQHIAGVALHSKPSFPKTPYICLKTIRHGDRKNSNRICHPYSCDGGYQRNTGFFELSPLTPAMFQFDPKGYLIPDRPIKATLEQFQEYFVENMSDESRTLIFNYFRQFCAQILQDLQLNQIRMWADGSFSTHRRNPNDLDIVLFVDVDLMEQHHNLLQSIYHHDYLQTHYRIDAYWVKVYPEDHPLYHITRSDTAYWMNLFTRTYRNRRGISNKKGFLDLIISSHEI